MTSESSKLIRLIQLRLRSGLDTDSTTTEGTDSESVSTFKTTKTCKSKRKLSCLAPANASYQTQFKGRVSI